MLKKALEQMTGTLDASYYKGQGSIHSRERDFVAYENHPTDSRIKTLDDGTSPTVVSRWGTGGNNQPLVQAMAFEPGSIARNAGPASEDVVCPTLRKEMGDNQPAVRIEPMMQVRRLTPTECERLQGFPDGWTQIPWRKKGAEDCPDGPRYKAIGNSMAVNVMQWIGIRLAMVEEILNDQN